LVSGEQNTVGVVSSIGETLIAANKIQQVFGDGRFVALAGSDSQLNWPSLETDDSVDFGREAAARASNSVGFWPAPAPSGILMGPND
jgi:hypothetical protein